MADYRKILELLLEGRSYREVVEIVGCSHRDVARVKQSIEENGVISAVAVSDAVLAGWFPDGRRNVSDEYDQPDLSRVLASMKQNRHFTLLLAWRRYVDIKDVGKKYGYSQFCALFTGYLRTHTTWSRCCGTSRAGRCSWTGPATRWTSLTLSVVR